MRDIFLLAKIEKTGIPVIFECERLESDLMNDLFSIKNKSNLYPLMAGISEDFEGMGDVKFVQFGDKMMDVYENYTKLVKEKTNELRELANELESQCQKEFKKVQKEMIEYASPASNVKKDINHKEKKLKKKTDEPGI